MIILYIHYSYVESFSEGNLPNELTVKRVGIVPVYRPGDSDIVSNDRLVLILTGISTIFDKRVYNRLFNFIKRNNLLYTGPYGFRKRC